MDIQDIMQGLAGAMTEGQGGIQVLTPEEVAAEKAARSGRPAPRVRGTPAVDPIQLLNELLNIRGAGGISAPPPGDPTQGIARNIPREQTFTKATRKEPEGHVRKSALVGGRQSKPKKDQPGRMRIPGEETSDSIMRSAYPRGAKGRPKGGSPAPGSREETEQELDNVSEAMGSGDNDLPALMSAIENGEMEMDDATFDKIMAAAAAGDQEARAFLKNQRASAMTQ